MKLETAFGMMVRRAETLGSAISIREYHFLLYRFISEHVASTISFLESCSFDSVELKEMNSCRSHFQGLVEAVRKKDYETTEKHDMFNNMTLWIRSIVGFFAMLQRREIEIGRMIKDFQVLEEESIIFRDVLRQLEVQNSSGKPKPIEVTIRQITISDKSGYLKSQTSCDQSTMTESESTSTEFEHDVVVCNEEKAPIIKYETLFVPIMAPQNQTISRNPSISPKPNRKLSFISGDVTQEYRQPHIPVLVTQDAPFDALKRLSIAKRQSVSTKPANSSAVSVQEPTTITKSASVSAVSDSFPSTTNIYIESASTMSLATLHPTLSTTLTDTQTSTTNLNSTSQDLNSTSKHPSTTALHSQNSLSAATSQNMLSASPSHGNISTIASGVSTATSTKQGSMVSLAPKESKTVICGTDIPIPKSTDSTTQTLDIENPLQKTVNQYKKQVSDLQAALRTCEAKELETAAEASMLKETHAKHVLDVEKKFEGVIEVERCRVAEVLGRALELESKVAQLTNDKSNEAEILAMRDAEIVELKEEIEGLKRQVQELDKEKAQMESDLEVANMDVFTLQSEVATLKETLDAKQREFQTALEEKERELQACRIENQEMIESLKLEARKAVAEAVDAKGLMMQSKNRAGELHHQLVMLQERSSQIEDLYNALLVSCKANEYKVKELDAMVDTIMRYPDVSLGQPLEDPGQ
ncbi:hypothetical protein HDU79_002528 [Rhizoclosmatium sp. JEL0117]|nr:hypothetical protein HDU79_002528 [Rhizoclosmatium sp. JEL0117]